MTTRRKFMIGAAAAVAAPLVLAGAAEAMEDACVDGKTCYEARVALDKTTEALLLDFRATGVHRIDDDMRLVPDLRAQVGSVGRGWGVAWNGVVFGRSWRHLEHVNVAAERLFGREARYNAAKHRWEWPGGERLRLRPFARPDDSYAFLGNSVPWMGWSQVDDDWPSKEVYQLSCVVQRSWIADLPLRTCVTREDDGWLRWYMPIRA